MRRVVSFVAVLPLLIPSIASAAEPRVLDGGYKLELVAKEPDIVTPIGMAFDSKGRLLVIESHTHQRPEEYEGPSGDCVRMLSDSDGDGRLDRWTTFAEGFQQAMNVCVRPDGGVYVVTRRDVQLLEDTDGNDIADQYTMILRLDTEAEYPHNGLSGIHIAPDDDGQSRLIVGLGENFGFSYRLVGSDGADFAGRGGVGAIFTCNLDGSKLERFASGFWNPFGICTLDKQVFCVENDPDASPPCRLIEVVPTGDYGHRWEYGRAGVHPLQAWNGELPGTLPMVCGVGEAPTAIVAHRRYLWVTSWGDHRIERYELQPSGGHSCVGYLSVAVQGDADFRPTGMAVAPDGSLFFGDWVDRSYPVHGKGRIWKLQVPRDEGPWIVRPSFRFTFSDENEPQSGDPFLRQTAVYRWSRAGIPEKYQADRQSLNANGRLCILQTLRWQEVPVDQAIATLNAAIADSDANVRLYAVRWIADERIKELRDDVAKLLEGEIPNERYFLAVIAAIEWLDGDDKPRTKEISDGLLRRELANRRRSPALHALALRLISPNHEWLTIDRLRGYLALESPALRLEAVRTLAIRTDPERFAALAEIAASEEFDPSLRTEAVVGLAAAVDEHAALLEQLAASEKPQIAREASRVLRLSRQRQLADAPQPVAADLDAWTKLLAEGGDAASGRRLFFTSTGPLCSACHQHGGRGGRVGPDLTRIAEQQSRERIIASILQPSREIAPHYQAWELVTADGKIQQGLRLPEAGDDGEEIYADTAGREFKLKSEDIELRSPSDASIMPDGLERTLSVDDLRDLVAFLSARE